MAPGANVEASRANVLALALLSQNEAELNVDAGTYVSFSPKGDMVAGVTCRGLCPHPLRFLFQEAPLALFILFSRGCPLPVTHPVRPSQTPRKPEREREEERGVVY